MVCRDGPPPNPIDFCCWAKVPQRFRESFLFRLPVEVATELMIVSGGSRFLFLHVGMFCLCSMKFPRRCSLDRVCLALPEPSFFCVVVAVEMTIVSCGCRFLFALLHALFAKWFCYLSSFCFVFRL